jgi:hypothetical protein
MRRVIATRMTDFYMVGRIISCCPAASGSRVDLLPHDLSTPETRRKMKMSGGALWQQERPDMTSHTAVAPHKSEQKQGRKPFPQCLGGRDVDLGAAAIRAIP